MEAQSLHKVRFCWLGLPRKQGGQSRATPGLVWESSLLIQEDCLGRQFQTSEHVGVRRAEGA